MVMSAQARDNFEALRFVAECLAEGDLQTLLALGFEIEDLRAMEQMTLADLRVLSAFPGTYLRRVADVAMFRRARSRAETERTLAAQLDTLIAQEAPYALVHELFGTSGGEYAARRRLLGVIEGVGRPAQAAEATERRVWTALRGLRETLLPPLSAEEWLELQARTGESFRILWVLVSRWSASGSPPPCSAWREDAGAPAAPLSRSRRASR